MRDMRPGLDGGGSGLNSNFCSTVLLCPVLFLCVFTFSLYFSSVCVHLFPALIPCVLTLFPLRSALGQPEFKTLINPVRFAAVPVI